MEKKEEGRGMKQWRGKGEESREEGGQKYEIEDDWDAYESD